MKTTEYKIDFDTAVQLVNRKKEIELQLKSGLSIPAVLYNHLVTSKQKVSQALQELYTKNGVE